MKHRRLRKIVLWMPALGEAGRLCARFSGDKTWVEFRGPPYSKWELGYVSRFQQVHDSLDGWQTSVLHAGDVLAILPAHAQYEMVRSLLTESQNAREDGADQTENGDDSSGIDGSS